jgi:ribosome-associated heat shock protein Hsp15
LRLDKWLWAARFFKTRSLAQRAIAAGRVKMDEARVKPAHELKVGDAVVVRVSDYEWQVKVKALSDRRGSADVARKLYDESAESRAERERRSDLRRWGAEPARGLKGRPTKRDRRHMDSLSDSVDEGPES